MKMITDAKVKELFGDFKYKEGVGGRIIIADDWVKKNIVYYKLPIVGYVHCHREVLFDLFRIFHYIEQLGLAQYVDVKDFRKQGGCFVPRHKCWNRKRGLSRHSWGIAIDLNVSQNPYGSKGKMHRGIIKVFADYGFLWGGSWRGSSCDPMHFEVSNQWKKFEPVINVQQSRSNFI